MLYDTSASVSSLAQFIWQQYVIPVYMYEQQRRTAVLQGPRLHVQHSSSSRLMFRSTRVKLELLRTKYILILVLLHCCRTVNLNLHIRGRIYQPALGYEFLELTSQASVTAW